jgi:hypothetical protein
MQAHSGAYGLHGRHSHARACAAEGQVRGRVGGARLRRPHVLQERRPRGAHPQGRPAGDEGVMCEAMTSSVYNSGRVRRSQATEGGKASNEMPRQLPRPGHGRPRTGGALRRRPPVRPSASMGRPAHTSRELQTATASKTANRETPSAVSGRGCRRCHRSSGNSSCCCAPALAKIVGLPPGQHQRP